MTLCTRRIEANDALQSHQLGAEAFGVRPGAVPHWPVSGRSDWGVFDGEKLIAQAFRRQYTSWFGGAQVPTCGYAGVTVAAEYRGRGLLEPLLHAVQSEAREAGEVLSTLFASAPGIYRRVGFELIGSCDVVEVPTASAAAVRAPAGVHTRRAEPADMPAIMAVYDTWAAAQNGPLTRRGASFGDRAPVLPTDHTGLTLACDSRGAVLGYTSWVRGPQESDPIEVDDLLAVTADAYCALWRVLGSFSAVTETIRLRTSGTDTARLFLPARAWRTVAINPYMLRVDDVVAAMNTAALTCHREVVFAIAGDRWEVMNGYYRLTPDGGRVRCEPVPAVPTAPVFTPGGFALAWAGVQSCANIRMAGGLAGDAGFDVDVDAMFTSGQVHIRDAF